MDYERTKWQLFLLDILHFILWSQPLLSYSGFENDKGLQLTQEMKHYGFSSKFPTPLETKGKDIVLQYELKLEEGLTCGGLYQIVFYFLRCFFVVLLCFVDLICVVLFSFDLIGFVFFLLPKDWLVLRFCSAIYLG